MIMNDEGHLLSESFNTHLAGHHIKVYYLTWIIRLCMAADAAAVVGDDDDDDGDGDGDDDGDDDDGGGGSGVGVSSSGGNGASDDDDDDDDDEDEDYTYYLVTMATKLRKCSYNT